MIPRSTWSRPGARETGPRRWRAVVARGAFACVPTAQCEDVSYQLATHRVKSRPFRLAKRSEARRLCRRPEASGATRGTGQASLTQTCLIRVYSSIE